MATVLTPIFSHWSDPELETALAGAAALDKKTTQDIRAELDRRAEIARSRDAALVELDKTKKKVQDYERHEARQAEIQKHRAEALASAPPIKAMRDNLLGWCAMSRNYADVGQNDYAFVLDAIAMLARDDEVWRLRELIREHLPELCKRWHKTHKTDRDVVLFFDEVFPREK